MKLRYLSLGAVALGFVIGGSASQANADVPGGSGCEGSATWLEDGLSIVAETDDYVAISSEFRSLAKLPGVKHAQIYEPKPEQIYVWRT